MGWNCRTWNYCNSFSGWKVLLITACEQMAMVRQLVGTGIQGYLTRTCDRQEIEEAIMRVAKGETTYCHKVLDILMGQAPADSERCDPAILSEREVEIMRLIASGLTTERSPEIIPKRTYHLHPPQEHHAEAEPQKQL